MFYQYSLTIFLTLLYPAGCPKNCCKQLFWASASINSLEIKDQLIKSMPYDCIEMIMTVLQCGGCTSLVTGMECVW